MVDSAVAIHTALGRGLLESVYRRCLMDVIHPVHRAQLLAYLKLSGHSIGLLINWKVPRIKDGIQRMIWREP
ncbi:MAG TPA: GxxExxY protein [Acidobacteriota bacterium]|nr:GxxExxY protein [Acidobacteriota bacterium]